jgi:hypothetical protein
LSKLPAMDKKKMDENIKQLAYLFNSINNIISAGEWRFSDIFLPLRGKILGKVIGKFFEEIIKAVDGKTIKVELNGVADLLKVFSPFLDKDSTFSIRRMRSILNEKTGKEIGAFFSAIIDAMPTQKKAKPQLDGVVQLLEVITNFSKKDFKML